MSEKYSLLAKLGADTTQFTRAMKGAKKTNQSFVSNLKGVAGAVGVAFSAQHLISFGNELTTIGSKAKGVRDAFTKLGRGDLMGDLRTATRNTVDDLKLMQAAVKAKNFKIPLSQLATYFDFATRRATQTGESVDYLVDSIINGIGRKSTLVLDNLGISAAELQDEMAKTGDFASAAGAIIHRELGNMSDIDESILAADQLTTTWKNFKILMGEGVAPAINEVLLGLNEILKIGLDDNLTGFEKFLSMFGGGTGQMLAQGTSAMRQHKKSPEYLAQLKERAEGYRKLIDLQTEDNALKQAYLKQYQAINAEILELDKNLKKLNKPLKAAGDPGRAATSKPTGMTGGAAPGQINQGEYFNKWLQGFRVLEKYPDKLQEVSTLTQKLAGDNEMLAGSYENLTTVQQMNAEAFMMASQIASESATNLAANIVNASREIIKAQLAQAVSAAITSAMLDMTIPIWAKIAVAGVAAGATMALFDSVVPKLAEGGLAYAPQLAMVGDNPNARTDPEVIAPLSKLQGLVKNDMGGNVVFKISGNELKGVLRRHNENMISVT